MDALPPPYATNSPTSPSPYEQEKAAAAAQEINKYTYTQLPAFNTPRKYSSRLRRLLQQRSSTRGVYLTLHIPHNASAGGSCRFISIESASTQSSEEESCSDSDSISEKSIYISTNGAAAACEKTPLLSGIHAGIPLVEDIEAGTLNISSVKSKKSSSNKNSVKRVRCRRDPRYRYNPRHGDRDTTSWLTFFGLLLLIFTVVCAAGVFIAWATGFTSGRLAAAAAAANGGPVGQYGYAVTTTTAKVAAEPVGVVHVATSAAAVTDSDVASVEHEATYNLGKRSRVWRHVVNKRSDMLKDKTTERSADDVMDDVVF